MGRYAQYLPVLLVIALGWSAEVGRVVSGSTVPAMSVRFLDVDGGVVDSFNPGETVSLYVQDGGLGPNATSTGTWVDIKATVDAGTWWNLADGTPHSPEYSITAGSVYNTSTPSLTPLILPSSPWVATVDGTATLITDFRASTGEVKLLTDADQGSTVQVVFKFEVPDLCTAADQVARVASSSDPAGEWVAISEVASETDASPSPASGLFRGQVELSGDPAATASGDGAVWVQAGDTLTASYVDSGTVIDTHAVPVTAAPASTPTAIPSASAPMLAVLAAAFVILAASMLLGRPPARG